MALLKTIRVLISLTVFVLFAYIATLERSRPRPQVAVSLARLNVAIVDTTVKPQGVDVRELALELPDSLLPFSRGLKTDKEVALSFDACPTSGENHFNSAIANILRETKTPATIFLSGKWVEEDTVATRLLASDSLIELGNHSYTHPHLTKLSTAKMKEELERTQEIIANLTGRTPFLFRAPFGEYNDTLMNVARAMGLATVQYDFESGDPDSNFTAKRLTTWVTQKTRNGSILIMHINNRGWHTAQALPGIIQFLRRKGFSLVKVSDLMKKVSEELSHSFVARSDLLRGADSSAKY